LSGCEQNSISFTFNTGSNNQEHNRRTNAESTCLNDSFLMTSRSATARTRVPRSKTNQLYQGQAHHLGCGCIRGIEISFTHPFGSVQKSMFLSHDTEVNPLNISQSFDFQQLYGTLHQTDSNLKGRKYHMNTAIPKLSARSLNRWTGVKDEMKDCEHTDNGIDPCSKELDGCRNGRPRYSELSMRHCSCTVLAMT